MLGLDFDLRYVPLSNWRCAFVGVASMASSAIRKLSVDDFDERDDFDGRFLYSGSNTSRFTGLTATQMPN